MHNRYHRSLTDYVEALRRHRFAVTRLYEPEHIPLGTTNAAEAAFARQGPVFLLVEATALPR
ncbi:MAG TPA: hypothetical protein VFU47_10930 [Armatimonadota bacterium]|nr:hypothetical protein [Armatimonadota bacterium]